VEELGNESRIELVGVVSESRTEHVGEVNVNVILTWVGLLVVVVVDYHRTSSSRLYLLVLHQDVDDQEVEEVVGKNYADDELEEVNRLVEYFVVGSLLYVSMPLVFYHQTLSKIMSVKGGLTCNILPSSSTSPSPHIPSS
jgi:hypothetical protein